MNLSLIFTLLALTTPDGNQKPSTTFTLHTLVWCFVNENILISGALNLDNLRESGEFDVDRLYFSARCLQAINIRWQRRVLLRLSLGWEALTPLKSCSLFPPVPATYLGESTLLFGVISCRLCHRKKEKRCWKWTHLGYLMFLNVTGLLFFVFLFVNPQWKNVECPKYSYAHFHTVVSETAALSGSRPPSCDPHNGHNPTSARIPRPDGPHLLPGTRLSARLSESRPTCKSRHAPRKEPPSHTFAVRFQTHDGTTQSQPQGKSEGRV